MCVADQKLVFIACVCHTSSHPQPRKLCSVISHGCKRDTEFVCEESFLPCCLVHKKNFPKLEENNKCDQRLDKDYLLISSNKSTSSLSRNNTELDFTLLFCIGRQRNVPRIITHVHSHCSPH